MRYYIPATPDRIAGHREREVGGYSASIPALPGCHTQGETLEEVREKLREAAEGWLAVAHDDALANDLARRKP